MALYYFDADDGRGRINDDVGTDMASDAAARSEAKLTLTELAKDRVLNANAQAKLTMWVRNHVGQTLMVLTLAFSIIELAGTGP